MDITKALKDNEKPFGLMSEEMQAKAMGIHKTEFVYYDKEGWMPCTSDSQWCNDATYRLRPDYEESGVVELVVEEGDGRLFFTNKEGSCILCDASKYVDFIGFKYESNMTDTVPRLYRTEADGVTKYKTGILTDEVDEWEVLTPTHVLFGRSK